MCDQNVAGWCWGVVVTLRFRVNSVLWRHIIASSDFVSIEFELEHSTMADRVVPCEELQFGGMVVLFVAWN